MNPNFEFPSLNVILDLDNTLIETLPNDLFNKLPRNFTSQFNIVDFPSIGAKIILRPGLRRFLDFLFDNFRVSIFTAASKDYAQYIRDKIVAPPNTFTPSGHPRVIYSMLDGTHNDFSKRKYGKFKQIKTFSDFGVPDIDDCNSILIDDLDEVQAANPNNVIRILPFKMLTLSVNKCNAAMAIDNELQRVARDIIERRNMWIETNCVYDLFSMVPRSCSQFEEPINEYFSWKFY
jgi:hypothetical protein